MECQCLRPGHPTSFGQTDLLWRDLNEVHLLMDFISGRPDKSLGDIDEIFQCAEGPVGKDESASRQDGDAVSKYRAVEERERASACVVQAICRVGYPLEGSERDQARTAALILLAKDRLNELAYPSKGLTVAFTSMFAGVGIGPKDFPPKDHSAALAAYPNLEWQARGFRRFHQNLFIYALVLVLALVYLNWDVSMNATALQRSAEARHVYELLFDQDRATIPATATCDSTVGPNDKAWIDCRKLQAARIELLAANDNLDALLRSPSWWRPVPFSLLVAGLAAPHAAGTLSSRQFDVVPRSPAEDPVLGAVNALRTVVIPALFGMLGTIAGLMRSIMVKVRDSVLAPRDWSVSRVALIMGTIAGLAVGLYWNVDASRSGPSSLPTGTMLTTAAGLSFLAGFGSEAFFAFLDGLLRQFAASTANVANGVQTAAKPFARLRVSGRA